MNAKYCKTHSILLYFMYWKVDRRWEQMATITVRINDEEKKVLDQVVEEMGLNYSTFYSIYTKKVLRERRIPFEVSASVDPFYSESNMRSLKKSIKELREGKGKVHELIEVEDE